jgi:Ni,Fe-hydrogenase I cytochrome b subunit
VLPVKPPSVLKIIAGWFVAGLVLPLSFLYLANPLAGLALFTVFVGALFMVIGPIAHILLAKRAASSDSYQPLPTVAKVGAGILVVAFIIASFGFFNFA